MSNAEEDVTNQLGSLSIGTSKDEKDKKLTKKENIFEVIKSDEDEDKKSRMKVNNIKLEQSLSNANLNLVDKKKDPNVKTAKSQKSTNESTLKKDTNKVEAFKDIASKFDFTKASSKSKSPEDTSVTADNSKPDSEKKSGFLSDVVLKFDDSKKDPNVKSQKKTSETIFKKDANKDESLKGIASKFDFAKIKSESKSPESSSVDAVDDSTPDSGKKSGFLSDVTLKFDDNTKDPYAKNVKSQTSTSKKDANKVETLKDIASKFDFTKVSSKSNSPEGSNVVASEDSRPDSGKKSGFLSDVTLKFDENRKDPYAKNVKSQKSTLKKDTNKVEAFKDIASKFDFTKASSKSKSPERSSGGASEVSRPDSTKKSGFLSDVTLKFDDSSKDPYAKKVKSILTKDTNKAESLKGIASKFDFTKVSSESKTPESINADDLDDLSSQLKSLKVEDTKTEESSGSEKESERKSREPSPSKEGLEEFIEEEDPNESNPIFQKTLGGLERDDEVAHSHFQSSELLVPGLNVKLYPHQVIGLDFFKKRESEPIKGGLLCDDMGLGKTIQMIALMLINRNKSNPENSRFLKTSLILCPPAVMHQWKQEIETKASGLSVMIYHGPKRAKLLGAIPKYDVVITTYPTATSEVSNNSQFLSYKWFRIIADEAHQIKNPLAERTKAINKLTAERKWCLTGTPVQNDAYDLLSLLNVLRIDDERIDWSFLSMKQWKEDSETCQKNLRLLRELLKSVMLRRTKAILKYLELPPKRMYREMILLSPEERGVYNCFQKIIEHCKLSMDYVLIERFLKINVEAWSYASVVAIFLRLRQYCSYWKIVTDFTPEIEYEEEEESSKELVSDMIKAITKLRKSKKYNKMEYALSILKKDPTRKTIIFTNFTSAFRDLVEILNNNGFECVVYHGGLTTEFREKALTKFRESPNIPILLCSIQAGGVGLNLTAASRIIFLDPWWNPAIHAQATDRVYRIGQVHDVDAYELVTHDSVEERMYETLDKKKELSDTLIENKDKNKKKKDVNKLSMQVIERFIGTENIEA
ncbi:uncharacterized protein J8A68_003734 [[Candida] subhashii]|uniref:Uncharacterized protein n=1 Tax=[Candida] subhashii TaxID=561895 RepID=A0A8J5ULD0_9ASCO|nr:uncharacterized protein J8A68_003734 [[Candida] subhashii]KAG7662746.1 hypothetical protein J8A68_003734 [[Candida] subhashii]